MLTEEEARSRLATHPLPANAWVYATDRAIVIKAEYTDTIERLLRWVPKTRWSAKHRCWIVPLSGLELVRSILPELSRLAEAMQTQPVAAEATGTTARALKRDEAALAGWLVGQGVMEAPPPVLLGEMLALMRRRVVDIAAAADMLERQLTASGIAPLT